MRDEMENAFIKLDPNFKLGNLVSTGIKLKATNITLGKPTTTGFQVDNTRMEIMAVSDVKVEVVGFNEMYEVLNDILNKTMFTDEISNHDWQSFRRKAVKAINLVDENKRG